GIRDFHVTGVQTCALPICVSLKVWLGIALFGTVLAVLPFVLGMAGQSWVRTLNFALLYVMLALGLNIVVGFAGLLDLGYIAFYEIGRASCRERVCIVMEVG